MESDTLLALIFEWAVLPLYAVVVWLALKVFNLDKHLAVLTSNFQQEAATREQARKELRESMREDNTRILDRLDSMEQSQRERNNTG